MSASLSFHSYLRSTLRVPSFAALPSLVVFATAIVETPPCTDLTYLTVDVATFAAMAQIATLRAVNKSTVILTETCLAQNTVFKVYTILTEPLVTYTALFDSCFACRLVAKYVFALETLNCFIILAFHAKLILAMKALSKSIAAPLAQMTIFRTNIRM